MLKRFLKRLLPHRARAALREQAAQVLEYRFVREEVYRVADAWDRLRGRSALVPPRRLIHAIGGGFEEVGPQLVRLFIDWAGLRPDERVLDVGCGSGRVAVRLAEYLRPPGRYEGFDVMADCVRWCAEEVTPRFPHFRFRHADLYNREYNPDGRFKAAEYRFPYDDGAFDFAAVTSVFTHLLPADLDHYLAELARVLRPGGRCVATFFLLNDESRGLAERGESLLDFRPHPDGCHTTNFTTPEEATAYDESAVRQLLARHGLAPQGARYGSWCGREGVPDYQDVLLIGKP
jgi:SAM-dependent methyltransferase